MYSVGLYEDVNVKLSALRAKASSSQAVNGIKAKFLHHFGRYLNAVTFMLAVVSVSNALLSSLAARVSLYLSGSFNSIPVISNDRVYPEKGGMFPYVFILGRGPLSQESKLGFFFVRSLVMSPFRVFSLCY